MTTELAWTDAVLCTAVKQITPTEPGKAQSRIMHLVQWLHLRIKRKRVDLSIFYVFLQSHWPLPSDHPLPIY